jgi:anthranilate synthase component 1
MKALSYDDYQRLSEGGLSVPVFRELPGDLRTPVSAFFSLGARSERAFLLERPGPSAWRATSFLGRTRSRGSRSATQGRRPDDSGTHEATAGLMSRAPRRLGPPPAEIPDLPRFTGGAVGYLTWDAARLFERLPDQHGAASGTVASFSFYRSLVAFDHVRQRLVLMALAAPGSRAEYDRATGVLDALERDLGWERRAPDARRVEPPAALPFADGSATATPSRQGVHRARRHLPGGALAPAHGRLRARPLQRLPRAAHDQPVTLHVLPEGRRVVDLRRVARDAGARRRPPRRDAPDRGTRPRGAGRPTWWRASCSPTRRSAPSADAVDLGATIRASAFGSVQAAELMKVGHYSHVAHMSRWWASQRGGRADALAATFPAGTPRRAKSGRWHHRRAEPSARGLYGGALGYIDLGGNLDFCIAIRTLVIRNGRATLQSGAGIVADSDPATEERETVAKAQAIFDALSVAGGLA